MSVDSTKDFEKIRKPFSFKEIYQREEDKANRQSNEEMTSQGEEAVQLINEEKQFNTKALEYFQSFIQGRDVGVDYHVISVFGSQSSGKSTLLNALFNTQFDTMNAQLKRQQTTKGIWLAHTQHVTATTGVLPSKDLFVLDVEGSDGAERGEDQDFERKAALFAIAISEILIVNIWEQQVGLYQGNNMALLKTVFEVNLSLFGNSTINHKVLLLFVIRDYVGVTPLESLQESLIAELEKIWSQLSKPKGTEDSSLYDFFDLKFAALAHKFLQPDEFTNGVQRLGDSFNQENKSCYFKPEYHHNLPLDGWTMYAENCWEQIETNKDLDLPTQQILVARFKTEEIANAAYSNFLNSYDKEVGKLSLEHGKDLASKLYHLRTQCLQEYDTYGSRYAKTVYLEKRTELSARLETKFRDTLNNFLELFTQHLSTKFHAIVTNRSGKTRFIERLELARDSVTKEFSSTVSEFSKLEVLSSVDKETLAFNEIVDRISREQRDKELKSIISRSNKFITSQLKDDVIYLLSHPEQNVWDLVMEKFEEIFNKSISKYELQEGVYDFQVGSTKNENLETYKKIRSNAWIALNSMVHDYLKEDTVVSILRERFENKFRYDENDSPKLWKNEEEIDKCFRLAKEHTLEVLNVLAIASTSDNVEIIPDIPLHGEGDEEEHEDEDGLHHDHRFAHILTALQKERVVQKFKRQADITAIEAKRSTIKTTTQIPLYIYALIAVLGWNEFMIIIRNPIFVTVLLILGVAFYFVQKMKLWTPLMNVANAAMSETTQVAKDKLRTLLFNEHETTIKAQSVESFEMQDLSKGKEEQKKAE